MKKEAAFVALTATNFPDNAFLTEVCRVLGANPGDHVPAAAFAEITQLDVCNRGIQRLKGLMYFTGLKDLYCSGNRISRLDVSCCPTLETISCGHNVLTRLTVHGCSKLHTLVCDNNCLCSLDLTGCESLRELLCSNNMLRTLDTSAAARLEMLQCHGNPAKSNDILPRQESRFVPTTSAC